MREHKTIVGTFESSQGLRMGGFFALIAASLAVRFAFFDSLTYDTTTFVLPWYREIVANGYAALGAPIPNLNGEVLGNYTPPYYYLLYIVSLFDGWLPELYLVKIVTLPFEGLAAFFAFRIVRLVSGSERSAWIAVYAVLFAPTLIANGAWWGQCDVIWTSLLLGTLYFAMREKPLPAVLLFGAAVAFKAQAVFLSPFLLLQVLSARMPLRYLLWVPLVYLAFMLPAIVLGQTLADTFNVYMLQAQVFARLSMNAPNLYYFIPNEYYVPVTIGGLLLMTIAAAVLAALPRWTKVDLTLDRQVLAAAMFVALAPFLLPKMHDRYFFAADIFVLVAAIALPRLWVVAAMFQASSLIAYIPIASLSLTGNVVVTFMPIAVLLNTVSVAFLLMLYWHSWRRSEPNVVGFATEYNIVAGALATTVAVWMSGAMIFRVFVEPRCPGVGGLAWLCERQLPLGLADTHAKHRIVLVVILMLSYVFWRLVLRRAWPAYRTSLVIPGADSQQQVAGSGVHHG